VNAPSLTIVLGAGSSAEVGLPVGSQLKKTISFGLAIKSDAYGHPQTIGNLKVLDALKLIANKTGSGKALGQLQDTAMHISQSLPLSHSIDNFIDTHRGNPLIAQVGKLAIVSAIRSAEKSSSIYVDPRNYHNTIDFNAVEGTWYAELFKRLTTGIQLEELAERLKRVCIVTFNYDRTLEHFLFHAFRQVYKVEEAAAANILNNLRIYHVYGTVGALPWQVPGAQGGAFGEEPSAGELLNVSENLRTFTEGTDEDSSEIVVIRELLKNSMKVLFLGFSYHRLNLKLLYGEGFTYDKLNPCRVWGSAKGLSNSDRDEIEFELKTLGQYQMSLVLREDALAVQMMRDYSRSIDL
jgi:hypothetical protein